MSASRVAIVAFAANLLLCLGAAAAEPVKVVVIAPGQGALKELVQAEVTAAAALGKVPFVQLTADWCAPCRALRASLGDPLMQAAFAGTYVIQVDADAWRDELKQAGFDHPAIPVFFGVDAHARPTGAKIDGGAWGEDIPRNMAPPLERFFKANLGPAP